MTRRERALKRTLYNDPCPGQDEALKIMDAYEAELRADLDQIAVDLDDWFHGSQLRTLRAALEIALFGES